MAKISSRYKIFSASSAFFVWGSWSYYVNSSESKGIGLVSGIVQGIASFLITLLVVFAVTQIYNSITYIALKMIMPSIITVSGICILLIIVHSIVGTPHIFYTIAPSLTVAFVFCLFTTFSLRTNKFTYNK